MKWFFSSSLNPTSQDGDLSCILILFWGGMIHLWPHSFGIGRSFSWRLMLMSQQWMNSTVCGRLRHKQDLHFIRGLGDTDWFGENESHFDFGEVSVRVTMSIKPDRVNAHAAFRLYWKIGLDMGLPIRACFHCRYSWQGRPVGVYTDAACSKRSEQQQKKNIWEKVWNCTRHRAVGNNLILEY